MASRKRLTPDRVLENNLLERYELVGGLDEVGRGSLAGPVSVGLAVVSRQTLAQFPEGLADSKQLTARKRESLVEPTRGWVEDYAVAHASPAEIDQLGIMGALHLAGVRALEQVQARGNLPGVIILDGTYDWLTNTGEDLFTTQHSIASTLALPPVQTQVKADATCAVVAAASVLAKVERDELMIALEDPGYGWASNKGYASAAHVEGLKKLGASQQHRRSWNLPGLS